MGASTFLRHFDEHFPLVSICPHKEDNCTALGIDMRHCTFVIQKITTNTSSTKQEPNEKELAALMNEEKKHLQDAKLACNFYNEMVARGMEQ